MDDLEDRGAPAPATPDEVPPAPWGRKSSRSQEKEKEKEKEKDGGGAAAASVGGASGSVPKDDAELARLLHQEWNAPTRRRRRSSPPPPTKPKKPKTTK